MQVQFSWLHSSWLSLVLHTLLTDPEESLYPSDQKHKHVRFITRLGAHEYMHQGGMFMPMPEVLQQYSMRLGFPGSDTLARIFGILFDGEHDLSIIQALPGTAQEIAERTGLPVDRVLTAAERLKGRGAIGHPMNRFEVYRLFPAMIELRDATVFWPEAPQELFELWERLISKELPQLVTVLKGLNVPPMVRVVPIERSIESQNTVLDIDSARKIFKDAELITALPCPCRTQARRNGKGIGCPAPDTSVCMQTNGFAQPILSRGLGQRLDTGEALKRIGEAEEAGLVHTVRNNVQKDMFMCNCCSCCCTGLYFVNQLNYPGALAPSRFRVSLKDEVCSGCGLCADRCQFHAIHVEDVASIESQKCFGCGNCVIACPEQALTLNEVRPREHIRIK